LINIFATKILIILIFIFFVSIPIKFYQTFKRNSDKQAKFKKILIIKSTRVKIKILKKILFKNNNDTYQ